MNSEPDLQRLLAPMAEQAVDLDGPAFRVDRERVLDRMARASRSAPSSSFRYAMLAAAGFVIVVLGGALWHYRQAATPSAELEIEVTEGSATELHGNVRAQLLPKQATRLAAPNELETAADSQAKVGTADGLQIELRSQTRVALGELQAPHGQLELLRGAVRCSVPHRAKERAFQVVTPDVTVLDLGTVFTVSIDDVAHVTRVSVEEGEVQVQHAAGQTRVRAPNSWSSAPPAPSAESPGNAASSASPSDAPSSTKTPSTAARVTSSKASTLAQEAQLLRQGLAAERQGRAAEAITSLNQLITSYPHSPLVPDARAALARVQARTSP